jgi:hypothetical protein
VMLVLVSMYVLSEDHDLCCLMFMTQTLPEGCVSYMCVRPCVPPHRALPLALQLDCVSNNWLGGRSVWCKAF